MSTSTFKRDDRVAYRAAFLRSIGDYSYERAQERGTVADVVVSDGFEQALIKWNNGAIGWCLSKNLIHADRIHLEPA